MLETGRKETGKDRVMTRRQLQKYLGIGNTTTQRLCEDRRFPVHRIGRRYIFLESEVVDYIRTHKKI